MLAAAACENCQQNLLAQPLPHQGPQLLVVVTPLGSYYACSSRGWWEGRLAPLKQHPQQQQQQQQQQHVEKATAETASGMDIVIEPQASGFETDMPCLRLRQFLPQQQQQWRQQLLLVAATSVAASHLLLLTALPTGGL